MIAEELGRALRIETAAREIGRCVREPDFLELYGMLGQREMQDAARNARPEVKHCSFLKDDPHACDALESQEGRPCPNNPFLGEKAEVFARLYQHQPLLDESHRLMAMMHMGILPDAQTISAAEFALAKAAMVLTEALQAEKYERSMEEAKMKQQAGGVHGAD